MEDGSHALRTRTCMPFGVNQKVSSVNYLFVEAGKNCFPVRLARYRFASLRGTEHALGNKCNSSVQPIAFHYRCDCKYSRSKLLLIDMRWVGG